MNDPIKDMKLSDMPPTLPFRMVEFWPQGWSHGHNHFGSRDESLETVAEGLSQGILDCNESKHNGHGRSHSNGDAQDAYFDAIAQLINHEDEKAYQELLKKIAHYQMWGGPPPEMVLMPSKSDPGNWQAIVKHPETGEAHLYDTRTNDFGMPDPRELGMKKNPLGPGWVGGKKRKGSS
jgi:hypothetical protein